MVKKFLLFSAAVLFLALLGAIAYCWHLSGKVDERFSSRRWSIPSKVFSDTVLLYPGQRVNRNLFQEKLKRTGYRKVSKRPARKGEMQITGEVVRLYLNDLRTPWEKRDGFPVTIEMEGDAIASITRQDNKMSLPLLEIEPEEIMLFFGVERERRQLVSMDQIPEHVVQAVLAAEDGRFF